MPAKDPNDHPPALGNRMIRVDVADHRHPDRVVQTWQNSPLVFHSGVDLVDQCKRMLDGRAAIGPDGYSIHYHHTTGVDHKDGGVLAEVMASFHQYYKKQLHPFAGPGYESRVDRRDFGPLRENLWGERAVRFLLRGGDGLLTRKEVEYIMGQSVFSSAIKDLKRYEATYSPGSQHSKLDTYIPGGIVIAACVAQPGIVDTPPQPTTEAGDVTWAFHILDKSWSAWWSGPEIISRKFNFGFDREDIYSVSRLARSGGRMSVDIGISGMRAEVTTIGCSSADDTVHTTLQEADLLIGYLAMGWDYEKGCLMTSDIQGYQNPLTLHVDLLINDPVYTECYTSFKRVRVQPTLTYRNGWIVSPDGRSWALRWFPFRLSLRFHLLDWTDQLHYIDVVHDGLDARQTMLEQQLCKPYLPLLDLFKDGTVLSPSSGAHTSCFERLRKVAALYDLCCWSKGLSGTLDPDPPVDFTIIEHHEEAAPGREVDHDRPVDVRQVECDKLETAAMSESGVLASLQWAHLCWLRRQDADPVGALRASIKGILQLIQSNTCDDPSNSVTLLICEGIIAITQAEEATNTEASVLMIAWQYYSLRQLRPDNQSTELTPMTDKPHLIAQVLYLEILAYALVCPSARHLDRLYETATALAVLTDFDGDTPDLDAVEIQIRCMQFESATTLLLGELAKGKSSALLYKTLKFCLLVLDSKQGVINGRHLMDLAKATGGDSQKDALAQARRQIEKAATMFPRTASWLLYQNAMFMATHVDSAWSSRAQGIMAQANVTETRSWINSVYKGMTGKEILLDSHCALEEVYQDGWAN